MLKVPKLQCTKRLRKLSIEHNLEVVDCPKLEVKENKEDLTRADYEKDDFDKEHLQH